MGRLPTSQSASSQFGRGDRTFAQRIPLPAQDGSGLARALRGPFTMPRPSIRTNHAQSQVACPACVTSPELPVDVDPFCITAFAVLASERVQRLVAGAAGHEVGRRAGFPAEVSGGEDGTHASAVRTAGDPRQRARAAGNGQEARQDSVWDAGFGDIVGLLSRPGRLAVDEAQRARCPQPCSASSDFPPNAAMSPTAPSCQKPCRSPSTWLPAAPSSNWPAGFDSVVGQRAPSRPASSWSRSASGLSSAAVQTMSAGPGLPGIG